MSRLMKTLGVGAAGVAAAGVAGGILVSVLDSAERTDAARGAADTARAVATLLEREYDFRVEAIVAGRELAATAEGYLRREMRGSILQNGQSKPFFAVAEKACDDAQPCWRLNAMFVDGQAAAVRTAELDAPVTTPASLDAGAGAGAGAGLGPGLGAGSPPAVASGPGSPRAAIEATAAALIGAPPPSVAPTPAPAAVASPPELSGDEADALVETAADLLRSAESRGAPAVAALSADAGRALQEVALEAAAPVLEIQGPATHEIGGSEVNLRAGPDTTYESLGLVPRGLQLRLLETSGTWGRFQVVDEASEIVARGRQVWVYLPLTAPL